MKTHRKYGVSFRKLCSILWSLRKKLFRKIGKIVAHEEYILEKNWEMVLIHFLVFTIENLINNRRFALRVSIRGKGPKRGVNEWIFINSGENKRSCALENRHHFSFFFNFLFTIGLSHLIFIFFVSINCFAKI